jgi:hypothetical protein
MIKRIVVLLLDIVSSEIDENHQVSESTRYIILLRPHLNAEFLIFLNHMLWTEAHLRV